MRLAVALGGYKGINGPSAFKNLLHLPHACKIDYMHTILYGPLADDLFKILKGYDGCGKNLLPMAKSLLTILNTAIKR